MTPTNPDIVATLIKIRCQRGLTQQDVADRMRVTRSAVANVERRIHGHHLNVTTLFRYADAVDADIIIQAREQATT